MSTKIFVDGGFIFRDSRAYFEADRTHEFESVTGLDYAGVEFVVEFQVGEFAGRIFFEGRSLLSFELLIVGFVTFFVLTILAPLCVFTPQLARAKREGLKEYGTLASSYVMDFRQKWLQTKPGDEQLLGTPDLQSLADLGNSFTMVLEMRAIPVATQDVVRLLIVTVSPIIPLLLTIMPLEQWLHQGVMKMF